jgi:hypothetical protein
VPTTAVVRVVGDYALLQGRALPVSLAWHNDPRYVQVVHMPTGYRLCFVLNVAKGRRLLSALQAAPPFRTLRAFAGVRDQIRHVLDETWYAPARGRR